MDLNLRVQTLVNRINRRLAKLVPAGQLLWDYREKNYYLHVYQEPRQIIGPVYHSDLLAFATYINLWKAHERSLFKLLYTPHGPEQEGKLRTDLKVKFHTLFEHAYLEKKFPGRPAEKIFLVTDPVTDEDNIPDEIREYEAQWAAENDAPQVPIGTGEDNEQLASQD